MKLKNYLKRMVKYVLYDYKQPIIYANVREMNYEKLHSNKVYLITGGSSGIGYEIAHSLIKSGAKVIITGRDEKKLETAQKKLGSDRCDYIIMDISDAKNSAETLQKIFFKYKKIDGLINNAGISLHEKDFQTVTIDTFDKQFNTNLKGSYFLTQEYIKLCLNYKQKDSSILFISSERGSMCDYLPYGLTKVCINSLVQALSRKYYKKGFRINSIGPGVTCSPLVNKEKDDDLYLENAAGRYLLPEEISNVACFLLSDLASSVSGEIINCDAGNHIRKYFEE